MFRSFRVLMLSAACLVAVPALAQPAPGSPAQPVPGGLTQVAPNTRAPRPNQFTYQKIESARVDPSRAGQAQQGRRGPAAQPRPSATPRPN